MRHQVRRLGEAFALRPVTTEDAAAIVELRTDPALAKFLHATSSSVDDQIAWTERYYDREGDWYFVVERVADAGFEGAVAIYNHDISAKSAEWGRWILRKGSLAAIESATLIYDVAFDDLRLDSLYCRTEDANLPVISFHTTMGLDNEGLVVGPEGERWVQQRMTAGQWQLVRPSLSAKVAAAARLARR